MEKLKVIERIISYLEKEVELATKAQRETFEAATDEDAYSDGKYDTRSLETSYLAGGQAQLVKELGEALQGFRLMKANHFIQAPSSQAGLGSLIQMKQDNEELWYLLGPGAGGTEVDIENQTVTILTLHSPLGVSISGKTSGETVQLPIGLAEVITVS